MRVTKEITFDCAHRLSTYDGKCFNLHGHTYRLQVTIEEKSKAKPRDMVMDFNELKKRLEIVVATYDHRTILNINDDLNKNICNLLGPKMVYAVPYEPTAENMIREIKALLGDIPVKRIALWETPTSYAEEIYS